MTKQFIYLDHNASSAIHPQALTALNQAFAGEAANPSSLHRLGQYAKSQLASCRFEMKDLLGLESHNVFFTSGGTEGNFLAMAGMAPHIKAFIIGATEHPCLLENAKYAADLYKIPLYICPVLQDGTANLRALEDIIQKVKKQGEADRPFLASFAAANHETGILNPLKVISDLCHQAGGLLHTDACQALGKTPIDFNWVDLATLSSHKLGGPVGAGALLMKEGLPFTPPIQGGGQEDGVRPGTPAVGLIQGFVAAVRAVLSDTAQAHFKKLETWHREMECALKAVGPDVIIWGAGAPRLPQTTCVSMPGISSETQMMRFDLAGFAISAGSACSSGLRGPSDVLLAMAGSSDNPQEYQKAAASAVRISSGWNTEEADLTAFSKTWLHTFNERTLDHAC